jgi:hypothetical protein
MSADTSARIELETDPRFPSGKWTGFWLQRFFIGRQYMSLNLTFANGVVKGEGVDRVGAFIIIGRYDLKTGNCKLTKSYVGAHSLTYEGRNENDGQWIWGLWRRLTLDHGGFHLWPEGEDDPTGPSLSAEKETPTPAARKVKWETIEEPASL